MAKITPPQKTPETNKEPKATDQIPPEKTTVLQLTKFPEKLKAEFKAYVALSPYKTGTEAFEEMFREYKENHPV